MHILLGVTDEARALALRDALENRDENTACTLVTSGREVLMGIALKAYDVLILDSVLKETDGRAVLERMLKAPLCHCPYVVFIGQSGFCDACVKRDADTDVFLEAVDAVCALGAPYFYSATAEKREEQASALLERMNMPRRLKGRACLTRMIPLALANPKYRERYQFTLYPYAAKAFGCSADSVERCVRHAIEAAFGHGELAAIEGLFGLSYDPERGKPTNREFIAMCLVHLKEEYDLCPYGKD